GAPAQAPVAIFQGASEALLLAVHHPDDLLAGGAPSYADLGMQHAPDFIELLGIQWSAASSGGDKFPQAGQERFGSQVDGGEDEAGPERLLEAWTEERGLLDLFPREIWQNDGRSPSAAEVVADAEARTPPES